MEMHSSVAQKPKFLPYLQECRELTAPTVKTEHHIDIQPNRLTRERYSKMSEARMFPIQKHHRPHEPAKVMEPIYMRAYEVYCEVFRPQEAMVDFERGCRGGFGMGELTAFLWAYPFPRKEWRVRVDEAFKGIKGFD